MSVLELDGRRCTNLRSPDRMVKWSYSDTSGDPVRGSLRTIAHLDETSEVSERIFGVPVSVIQPPYNTGVAASAGTHDFDAVLDVYLAGADWRAQQEFFRRRGWAAWWRYPPAFGHHIHMISLGYRTKVGIYVPGQVIDYYNHALGLAGQHNPGSDDSWHPADIDSTIFDFVLWRREMEEDMGYKDWTNADRAALLKDVRDSVVPAVTKAIMDEIVDKDPEMTVRRALRQAKNAPGLVRELAKELGHPLGDEG